MFFKTSRRLIFDFLPFQRCQTCQAHIQDSLALYFGELEISAPATVTSAASACRDSRTVLILGIQLTCKR